MAKLRLISNERDCPPGFAFVPTLERKDLRRGVFALYVSKVDRFVESFSPLFPKLKGFVISPGAGELTETQWAPTLIHLSVPVSLLDHSAGFARIVSRFMVELAENQAATQVAKIKLERLLEDRDRWGEYTRQSYASLRGDVKRYTEWTTTALTALLQFKQMDVSRASLRTLPGRTMEFLMHERFSLSGAALLYETSAGWQILAQKGDWTHQTDLLEQAVVTQEIRQYGSEFYIPIHLREDSYLIALSRCQQPGIYSRYEVAFFELFATLMASVLSSIQLEDALQGELMERRQTEVQLERALQSRDAFLAGMSHELRTPLNVVLGETQLFREGVLGAVNVEQEQALDTISSSGLHLLALINDVLDLSKIEANSLELHVEQVDLGDLCRDVIRYMKAAADKKKIKIQMTTDIDDVDVVLDERRVKQILINLLNNAVKFTHEGGGVGLDVVAKEEVREIQLTTWDTGIGMSNKVQQQLFQPFFQVDSRLSRQYEGTGLGLTLVRQLARMHGGTISVESEEGKGSRFIVTLPFVSSPELVPGAETASDAGTSEPAVAAEKREAQLQFGNHTILLAEDNKLNQRMFSRLLSHLGYHVEIAENGIEVLRKVEEIKPDLVFMDVQMPLMDGLEATRQIRSHKEFRALPVIAMTGLAMAGDRERCLAAGCDDYVSKPIDIARVKNLLHDYLSVLRRPPAPLSDGTRAGAR